MIFRKKETEDEDHLRVNSSDSDNSSSSIIKVSFKSQTDVINTRSSFEDDNFIEDHPNHWNRQPPTLPQKRSASPAKRLFHGRIDEISQFLIHERWFHGTIAREVAEKRLNKDGEFFVRQSTHVPGQMILSGMNGGLVMHIVLIDADGRVVIKIFQNT